NAGFRSHFPALFEPVPDGTQNTEEDEGRPEEKEDERDVGISVEIQIGRKLREMGDQFQLEHLQLWFLSRCAMTSSSVISMLHMQMLIGRDDIIFGLPFTQRGQMGLFQLVTTLYNFLFPQERPQNARAQR
ncbi:hypothetical protein cypCar_00042481, partial [Cyprinus carpio]